MKYIKVITCLLICILFGCSSEKEERILVINGAVVNTDTKSILLVKPGQDMQYDSLMELPVTDGKFFYKTKLEHPEAVDLFLGEAKNVGGRFMPLILENDSIYLTIHSEEEFDKNEVKGGTLNTELNKYRQYLDDEFLKPLKPFNDSTIALLDRKKYFSDEINLLNDDLQTAKNHDEKIIIYEKRENIKKAGKYYSSEGQILVDKKDSIYALQSKWKQEYINENSTLVSYYLLLTDLIYRDETVNTNIAKSNLSELSKVYTNHPYNDLANRLINAIDDIKIGKEYLDFTSPDLEGNPVKLSDKIEGKVALLDLWATWCGPCIARSRTMVPLYNEYKDKGFTVVGVAGEFKNTDRLFKFLDKEKWPWLHLVELDRQNSIWQKYGVGNGGGGLFLIDKDGKILAIDPTAEEVRKQLETIL